MRASLIGFINDMFLFIFIWYYGLYEGMVDPTWSILVFLAFLMGLGDGVVFSQFFVSNLNFFGVFRAVGKSRLQPRVRKANETK